LTLLEGQAMSKKLAQNLLLL